MSDPADRATRPFLLERFTDFLSLEQGASPQTIEAYGRDLGRFVEYAVTKGASAPIDVTARLLRDFVYQLKDIGLAPASIRRSVSALQELSSKIPSHDEIREMLAEANEKLTR